MCIRDSLQPVQHLCGYAPVDGRIVVAVEFGDPLGERLRRIGGIEPQRSTQRRQFDPLHALVAQLLEVIPFGRRLVGCVQRVEQRHAVGPPSGPACECGFVGPFLSQRAQLTQSQQLALPLLPCVGDRGVFGGVMDAQRRVALLCRGDDVEAPRADGDLGRVGALGDVSHGVREDVLLRIAGEAVDHREIPLFDPGGRDGEMPLGAVGNILGRVGGGLVVLAGVDAEEREVARVAGPYPVVGVAAELADRRGRRADQAYVVELLVDEQKLLVAVVHLLDRGLVALAFGLGPADDFGLRFARSDTVGDLFHADEEAYVELLVGQFLPARHGPEAVGQVVVFDARMRLYGVVAAVVVGEQHPFGRNQFARAAAVEQHHGILHRGFVDRVDVFGREAESFGAHVVDALRDEAREPHALVGGGCQREERTEQGK